MMKEMFFFFCIVHVMANFYFQTETMADKKRENLLWLFIHISVYASISFITFTIILTGLPWIYCGLFVTSHTIIDSLKYAICNSKIIKHKKIEFNDTVIFAIDQMLHIVIIFFIVYSIKDLPVEKIFNNGMMNFFNEIHIQETFLISWTLKLILIHKPSNIFISSVLKEYRP